MSLRLIANWKLNGSIEFNHQWAEDFFKNFSGSNFKSIGIAPASVYLDHLIKVIGDCGIEIGAQNIYEEDINNKIRAIFVFLHDHFVACESNWTMFVQTKSLLTCCGTGARSLWNIQCGCFLPFSVHWRQSRICDTNDLGEQQR